MALPIYINPYAIPGIDRRHFNSDLQQRVMKAVCIVTRQTATNIRSIDRSGNVIIARHLFVYFISGLNSNLTDKEIGEMVRHKHLKKYDRTSVIYAKRVIQNAIYVNDPKIMPFVNQLRSML